MKLILFILLLFYSGSILPQANDLNSFLNTGKDLFTSPLHFDKDDWLTLGGVVFVTAGSFYIDDNVKNMVLRNTDYENNEYVNDDIYYQIPVVITAGTYMYGLIARDKYIRQVGLDLIESAAYSFVIDGLIKIAAGRSRPYTTTDVTEFTPFKKSYIDASFGSGHATMAFSVAAVLAKQSDNIFWKAGWFAAAGVVGAIRIYHNMHWFSDVVLGSSIGYFVGSFVTEENNDNISLGVYPGGLSFTLKF